MDYQYQAVEQPSNPRKTWPIVLSVVVALTVACSAGAYVYHNKRQEALDTCQQSLAEFSSARKAVLDTSENGGELQKLIRGALGVNDIIDAFADAATSAENTVDTEGCKADATITQLNLIAKTLDSATDSLNNSLKDIREKNGTNALQDSRNDSDGTTTNGPSSNTQSNTSSGQLLDVPSNGSSATESLDESKKELQQSLDKADKLVNKLGKDETLTLTGRKLLSALSKAVDSGQKLIENSNIKDSKYYKAAKVTLDEAIDVAENWVDRQASKTQ
ncbi:hypothetical protein [Bifidobacterium adolescentis]|jgi:hypothetical protein|uniref:M-like protein Szp3 n=1 Tax=Bifidobacterium adolescentis TaxID=1680 RepID=A0A412KCX6_BIFAD|nr:hypothetical protein [Bifidobacterium adolescentis]RGS66011.1 hypothetical protein DWX79_02735 [Bifidobacterium adolescentis]RGV14381.1 hypothetical protein DWW22_09345 [Bifidobacterium adolescentis]